MSQVPIYVRTDEPDEQDRFLTYDYGYVKWRTKEEIVELMERGRTVVVWEDE